MNAHTLIAPSPLALCRFLFMCPSCLLSFYLASSHCSGSSLVFLSAPFSQFSFLFPFLSILYKTSFVSPNLAQDSSADNLQASVIATIYPCDLTSSCDHVHKKKSDYSNVNKCSLKSPIICMSGFLPGLSKVDQSWKDGWVHVYTIFMTYYAHKLKL